VGREGVPGRLRSLLNVESGLNDGLALPVVLVLLSLPGSRRRAGHPARDRARPRCRSGLVVPAVAALLLRSRYTSSTPLYASLGDLSIGLVVFSVASVTHANLFLAALTAGMTIATLAPDVERSFAEFGELITELLKLAAILVFGSLISPAFLGEIPVTGYVFAALALLLARPIAIAVSLARSGLPPLERAVAAWSRPKGLASVVYALLILEADAPDPDEMFHLIALVIFASILAHSSTDVPIAHAFGRAEARRSRKTPTALVPVAPENGASPRDR
jgi:NhaP-type Na+/H+ or K+/H+ antiporter